MDVVIDASAVVLGLIGKTDAADALRVGLPSMRLHAPRLIDAEVGNVLRRHERRGIISSEEARQALWAAQMLIDHWHPHSRVLAEHAWALRENVTFYDALYVALAAELDVPLVTSDSRLARAPGLPCELEIF